MKTILTLVLAAGLTLPALAQDFTLSPQPIQVPAAVAAKHITPKALPQARTVNISGLKAVLLVGPIDGDSGSWTTKEIANMRTAAAELRSSGVEVAEFYTPNNNWEQIKQAARGANFLYYRGHGVYSGNNPPSWVGGFSLKDKFASSENIKQDLKLAPGAVIMLYGCFTAGNSGFDIGQIDEAEAKRRVAMYAKPFFEMGAGAYYADWFGDAFMMLTRHLFAGKTLGETYKSYSDFGPSTVNYSSFPSNPALQMWVDHDQWSGTAYNYAFVGNPNLTLTDLTARKAASEPVKTEPEKTEPAKADPVPVKIEPVKVEPANPPASLTLRRADQLEVKIWNKNGQAELRLDGKLLDENEFTKFTDWVALPAGLKTNQGHKLTWTITTENRKKGQDFGVQVRRGETVIWELLVVKPDQPQAETTGQLELKPAP